MHNVFTKLRVIQRPAQMLSTLPLFFRCQLLDLLEKFFKVAWTLFAFKKNWVQQVLDPRGELVGGGLFADVIGSDICSDTHEFSLENSQTFSTLYRELLKILDQRYGGNTLSEDPVERRAALAIKQEIAGTYPN
jgi:hypothetical protein